jgi:hypothetical protein
MPHAISIDGPECAWLPASGGYSLRFVLQKKPRVRT